LGIILLKSREPALSYFSLAETARPSTQKTGEDMSGSGVKKEGENPKLVKGDRGNAGEGGRIVR